MNSINEIYKNLRNVIPVFGLYLPLAIGIDQQFLAMGIEPRVVKRILGIHTQTTTYKKNTVQHTHRYNLDGTYSSEITEQHRKLAHVTLVTRKKVIHFKKKIIRINEEVMYFAECFKTVVNKNIELHNKAVISIDKAKKKHDHMIKEILGK